MAKSARPVRGIDPQADAATDRMNERIAPAPAPSGKTFESMNKAEKDELLRQLAIRGGLITE